MNQVDKNKLREELDSWKQAQFLNAMNDHWSAEDYAYDRKCEEEIKRIKEILGDDNLSD